MCYMCIGICRIEGASDVRFGIFSRLESPKSKL